MQAVCAKAPTVFGPLTVDDVGIDGFIEVMEEDHATDIIAGVQIKSGDTYTNEDGTEFTFAPDWDHFGSWARCSFPVVDVVHGPSHSRSVWLDLTSLSSDERIVEGPYREMLAYTEATAFTPGGRVLYLGDAAGKWTYFEREELEALGVSVEEHGKMPDVVVHHAEKGWLVLVEAVTSHGPVDPKRVLELKELFAGSNAGLVLLTAFLNRRAMVRYLSEIAWETEVWVADAPEHLIHFDGERFLGPY